MWPLFCLALMIWKESKSNNSRWKRMKIIKPYWHHTSQTSHSKLFKNYFPFFFNLFFPIYYFSVLCFVTASLWVCKSSLLIYLLSFFPFSCFILLFIDFNSPNVWAILKDTSCLLLVFFFSNRFFGNYKNMHTCPQIALKETDSTEKESDPELAGILYPVSSCKSLLSDTVETKLAC